MLPLTEMQENIKLQIRKSAIKKNVLDKNCDIGKQFAKVSLTCEQISLFLQIKSKTYSEPP